MTTNNTTDQLTSIRHGLARIEHREWWLWGTAILVTLLLTLGILSFALPFLHPLVRQPSEPADPVWRGLLGLVLLFDIYVVYQQLQLQTIRKVLLQREELFRLISENAEDMIAVVDKNGNRIYNSPAYERILGYTREELKKTSGLEQVHPEDREKLLEAASYACEHGKGKRLEYRMRDKKGHWHFLESTASTVRNEVGEVDKLIIVNRDVTERRQLENQFLQAQKMEAIGRLSGGVAHDFNNLLGLIIGYAEVLEEDLSKESPLQESVEQILKSGRQAASLTRQLLAFSRQQVLEPKVVDVNASIGELKKMLGRLLGEDIELVSELSDELDNVKVDLSQLEQALINLAVNARDAMPGGGRLTIQTDNFEMTRELTDHFSYAVTPGSYLRIRVSDTGTGMSPETVSHAFEPFFTTKEKGKGTGLGLAMVYGFVKQSGGYIDIASDLGFGTTVSLYLPTVDRHAAVEISSVESENPEGGNETILLVEDETSLRELTARQLRGLGYQVLEHRDAESGMTAADNFKGDIDLLVSDVVLPGVNGRVFAEALQRKRPTVKVLYISGYSGQILGKSGILQGDCHFLSKPFSRRDLARKVREALLVRTGTTVH